MCTPDKIVWCDGSKAEYDRLSAELVEAGVYIKLNEEKRPNSYLARSHPSDVARVENRTFMCHEKEEDAGPTNNWMAPAQMKAEMRKSYDRCMKGRTMYVIPFSHGAHRLSHRADRHRDYRQRLCGHQSAHHDPGQSASARHAGGWRIHQMPAFGWRTAGTWAGKMCLGRVKPRSTINISPISRKPARSGPMDRAMVAMLCLARNVWRCASLPRWRAKRAGWPSICLFWGCKARAGEDTYIAAAFPSACGKTNLAMVLPPEGMKDWKVYTVGDDIAWIKPHKDGTLRAINPEYGFFGVAPGTSYDSNPMAMESMKENCIFTNVALTDDGDVWWEDMDGPVPDHLIDWKGNDWTPDSETPAAHPNSRFTAPAGQCPSYRPALGRS